MSGRPPTTVGEFRADYGGPAAITIAIGHDAGDSHELPPSCPQHTVAIIPVRDDPSPPSSTCG